LDKNGVIPETHIERGSKPGKTREKVCPSPDSTGKGKIVVAMVDARTIPPLLKH